MGSGTAEHGRSSTRDVDEDIEIAKREGLRIGRILETHVHADS